MLLFPSSVICKYGLLKPGVLKMFNKALSQL